MLVHIAWPMSYPCNYLYYKWTWPSWSLTRKVNPYSIILSLVQVSNLTNNPSPPLLLFLKHSLQLQFYFCMTWLDHSIYWRRAKPEKFSHLTSNYVTLLRAFLASYLLSSIPSIMGFLFLQPLRIVNAEYIVSLPSLISPWVGLSSQDWKATGWAKQSLLCV